MSESKTLTLSGRVDLQAKADGGAKADSPVAISIVGNTGRPMRVSGWGSETIVHLEGVRLEGSTPILIDHDARLGGMIGSGAARLEGGKLLISGTLARDLDETKRIVALSKAGATLSASIGLSVQKTEFIEAGRTVCVNGRDVVAGRGGLHVAWTSTLKEVSLLPLGADSGAAVSKLVAQGNPKMALEHDTTDGGNDPPRDIEAELARDRALAAAEVRRRELVADVFNAYSDITHVSGQDGKPIKVSTFKARAIREGLSPQDVEGVLFKAGMLNGAMSQATPAIHVRTPLGPEAQHLACSAAVSRSLFGGPEKLEFCGQDYGLLAQYGERVLEAADRPEVRNPTLHSLMDATIAHVMGAQFSGSRKSQDYWRAYVSAARQLEAASSTGFSTLTVGSILEDAGGKALLRRFATLNPTWPRIARTVPVDNFRPSKLYRLSESLGYLPLAPQGELRHGALSDSKRTVEADTYGRIISLDRQHIINDDLGAFQQMMIALADGAVWAIESAVAETLLSNAGSFFDVSNNNAIDSPLGLAGLEAAEVVFRGHVSESGMPIATGPSLLLTGGALSTTARSLLAPAPLLSIDANAANVTTANPFAGRLQHVGWSYLDNASIRTPTGHEIPNQSATKWYLLSDPAVGSVLVVALLGGRSMPTIQSQETSFNTLGMQWRGFHDFGVALGDPEYGVMSSGDGS